MTLSTSIMVIAQFYRAYDDNALSTYANAGILRRAQKDILANKVFINEETASSEKITLSSDNQTVTLPANGLNNASCDCSSVSACKHIIASVLYLQSLAAHSDHVATKEVEAEKLVENDDENEKALSVNHSNTIVPMDDKETNPTAISLTALEEVLTFELEDLQKLAKKIPKAKRAKALTLALNYFAKDTENKQNLSAQIINESSSIRIQLADQSEEIRYIAGAGFDGMLSKIERDTSSYHWLALLAIQKAHATEEQQNLLHHWLKAELSETSTRAPLNLERLSAPALTVLEDIAFDIEQLINLGLSHIDSYAANRMHLANTLARSQHLPRLAMQLRQLSGQMHDFINGDNHSNERLVLLSLAELFADLYMLRNSTGSELAMLRGKLRQQYDSDEQRADLQLLPLGARWWQSQGKARGLTLYFYEANEQQIIEFTQTRAQAQDLAFSKQTAWHNATWLSTAQNLMNQYSTLSNPRFNDNGGLAVTGSQVSASQALKDNFARYIQDIGAIAFDNWQNLDQNWQSQLGIEGRVEPLIILNPSKIGTLVIDEIEQCVWWPISDHANNQLRLRLNWNASEPQSIHNIEKLERINFYDIQMLIAHVTINDNVIELSPLTLVMTEQLFHLDYSQVPNKKNTLKDLLSGTISKLMSKKRRLTEIDNKKALTLTTFICEPVLSVLDSLAASGRMQPTEHQITQLRRQKKLAEDAGLIILAHSIESIYVNKVTIDSLLKLTYLCKIMGLFEIEMPIVWQSS